MLSLPSFVPSPAEPHNVWQLSFGTRLIQKLDREVISVHADFTFRFGLQNPLACMGLACDGRLHGWYK